jgi:hypothetical protein
MPLYSYCNEKGECYDEMFLSWRDAPKEIDGYVRQFPNPSVRFKGPFSGATKNIARPDDGSFYEKGTKDDQKRKKKYAEEKRDKARKDFLAEQVQTYDV